MEELRAEVATMMEKVNGLARMCNDDRRSNGLDGEEVWRRLRISPRSLQTVRDKRLMAC